MFGKIPLRSNAGAQLSSKASLTGATFTGGVNLARSSIVQHATTMNFWGLSNTIDGTGSAQTITAIVNAPQAGAARTVYFLVGTVITNNAMFNVQGNASYTTKVDDALVFTAITTSTYYVDIVSGDGTAVVASPSNGEFRTAQTITATGTYTPTAGMVRCKVTAVAGGGGGGGSTIVAERGGAGGGAGGASIGIFTAAQIGASQVVTIGAAGAAGTGTTAGGAGGTTSLGALISATGGSGGGVGSSSGGAGGIGSGGSLNIGGAGGAGTVVPGTAGSSTSGDGGASILGGGGNGVATDSVGVAGRAYGGGGSGGNTTDTTSNAGGAGAVGVIFIEEFF